MVDEVTRRQPHTKITKVAKVFLFFNRSSALAVLASFKEHRWNRNSQGSRSAAPSLLAPGSQILSLKTSYPIRHRNSGRKDCRCTDCNRIRCQKKEDLHRRYY